MPAPESVRARLSTLLPAAVVVLGSVLTAWALASVSGTAGVPRSDDWAYSRPAFALAATGHLRLVGWGLMNLVGQLVWAAPWIWLFGAHAWVLDLSTTVMTVLALCAAFALARRVLTPRRTEVVVLSLALAPGFLRDATSFRTDIPALALETVSLSFGLAELSGSGPRRSAWFRFACLGFGFWAFTVRQTALAAPCAVLSVHIMRRQTRRRALLETACLLVAGVGFWGWRSGLPGSQSPDGTPPLFMVVELVVTAFFAFALMLLPVLVWTAPRWLRPRHTRARAVGAGLGVLLAGYPLLAARWSWTHHPTWLVGDYLDPRGIGGDKLVLGYRPPLFPPAVWALLTVVAVLCAVVLCALLTESAVTARWHCAEHSRANLVLAVHLGLTGLGLVAAAFVDGNLYDRYLWPAVVPAAVLLVTRSRTAGPTPAQRYRVAGLAAAALVCLALTADSDAFDGALWHAGNTAVAGGYPAASVDAGFAWTGAHAVGDVEANPSSVPPGRSWWSAMSGRLTTCVEVASSPLGAPGLRLLGAVRWRPSPVTSPKRLLVYSTGDPACPSSSILESLLNHP